MFNRSVWIFLAVLFSGCASEETTPQITRRNIQRVMMHEQNNYTVFVLVEPNELLEIEVNYPTIKVDLKESESMYLETIDNGWGTKYIVHLHRADQINGAGWSRTDGDGDVTKGKTLIVE